MLKKVLEILNKSLTLPIILFLIFFLAYSFKSLNKHFSFDSHAFDLGIYTQITYLYSEGLLPYSSLRHMILLADHFGVILLLISPVYKLFPSPVTLLMIQTLFVSLSSIPLYLIAKDKTKSTAVSLLLTLSYLTSVGIISAISFDFHLATISTLPLSLVLYFWYFKKNRLYWVAIFFSFLFKEDMPLFFLGLGIYQVIKRQFKIGLLTIFVSIVALCLVKFLIMPFLWNGAGSSYLSTSILPLDSPEELFYLLLANPKMFLDIFFNSPIKEFTFNTLYREFAYLPLLSPLSWLSVFPHLYLRFSSNYTQTWTLYFHHNANILPFLMVSAIFAISHFKLPSNFVAIFLLFFLFLGGLSPKSFIYQVFKINNFHQYDYIYSALTLIPANAAVSAQTSLVPHLSNREKVYLFPEVYDAQFIILDTKLGGYPMQPNELKQKIETYKKLRDWELIKSAGSLYIFKKI